MALSLSVGCKNGLANTQGFAEMFNGGTLKIFTGDSPGVEYGATGSEIVSGTIAFTSAGTGSVTAQYQGTVGATGTVGYFRLISPAHDPYANANGTSVRVDGVCGVVEETSDLLFTGLAKTAGQVVTILGNFNV